MTPSREERRQALIRKFREVAAERVQLMSVQWIQLEQAPGNLETADELRRELHTLKGDSKMVNFQDVALLAHRMEGLFGRAKSAGFQMEKAARDTFIAGLDALGALVRRDPSEPSVDLDELCARIDGALTADPAALSNPSPPSPPVEARPATEQPKPIFQSWVRVPIDRVNVLSEVAGEQLIGQRQTDFLLRQIFVGLKRLESSADENGERESTWGGQLKQIANGLVQLDEANHQQSLRIQELDASVRELRLVPVGTLLSAYHRLVRDVGGELGKDVQLEIEGADLEADRRVLEVLEEPLGHLLRNAVDHGLESPSDREKSGKPPRGVIRIRIEQKARSMVLEIADDGRGIDPALVQRKALEKGLSADLAQYKGRLLDLIFLPGFSTRDELTMTSGRGVGMDVVKRRVEQLGGHTDLESIVGAGTRIRLIVPIAVSSFRCLLVPLADHLLAVPSMSVDSVREIAAGSLVSSDEGLFLRREEETNAAVGLADVLDIPVEGDRPGLALTLRSGKQRIAFLVNTVRSEEELVLKPLGPPLKGCAFLQGAALIESGEIALVLDPPELFALARRTRNTRSTSVGETPMNKSLRILVVEDSIIFRSSLLGELRAIGHTVSEADNGATALKALAIEVPDLIVTDLEMPTMDGYQLIKHVRASDRLQRVPVVVLSSLGAHEDKLRALEAGANAYLVKSDVSTAALHELVERLAVGT